MNSKKVKKIRKELRTAGITICAEPYTYEGRTRIGSRGRRAYQRLKREK